MADRFWVGGSATWDATAGSKWATTTGGAGGAAVPTAADDVYFDGNSTGPITLSGTSVCRSLDMTGYAGTVVHPAATTLTIGDGTAGQGNVAFKSSVSGMTYTLGNAHTSAIAFVSTSATQQSVYTATGNATVLGDLTFNGVGGSWNFDAGDGDGVVGNITLTNGDLAIGAAVNSISGFSSSNSNTRSITLNATLTLGAAAGGAPGSWNCATSTNLTVTANSLLIIGVSGSVGDATFAGGGMTYAFLACQTTGTVTISGSNTFLYLLFVTGYVMTVKLTSGTTQTATNFVDHNNSVEILTIESTTPGSPATISSTLGGDTLGTFTGTYMDITDSIASGGATFDVTDASNVNGGGNTGWFFASGGPANYLFGGRSRINKRRRRR